MQVLEGFWAGAARVGRDVDVCTLAERAGGWEALEHCNARQLAALGVPPQRCERWVSAAPVHTRGTVVRLCDAAYPSRLLDLQPPGLQERGCAPPPVLFVDGDVDVLSRPAVGIVGTRACTTRGASLARQLALAVVGSGHTVVSGLARGIDGHAHSAALQAGQTVAVVGHGLGHTSPASHRGLRRELVRRGGAVVSTWMDDVAPARHTFPQRNRWIAALSEELVVVEAPLRSGALITAEFAAAIGRPVWAAPGPIGLEVTEGCLALVERGEARLLTSIRALAYSLGGGHDEASERWLRQVFAGEALSEVARQRGVSQVQLLSELARLEVEGRVVRLPGRRYAPAGGAG